ncbi:hypothetical protein RIF29_19230 [Crotalaria pallida]|uniref:Mitochondrial import inner membrane translocase subunit TIM50 n=1 Tax=Crotalaria pallida TaxID=3830 RepID=A0AAN9F1L9_CROPI
MESHAVQSNNMICTIPKEDIKNAINHESTTVTDERKNEEGSSEISRISFAGAHVGCLKKKLLVLDVNGLLVDIVPPSDDHKADAVITGTAIFKRPFCLEFLEFCFEKFEVAVWSSRRMYEFH